MNKTLFVKIVAVVALTAIIAVALAMIESTIVERKQFHDEAVRSIAQDSVHEQSVVGPILIVPYTEEYTESVTETDDKKHERISKINHSIQRQLILYPEDLKISGNIAIDQRYRGIHKVLVYSGLHDISGTFVMPGAKSFVLGRTDSRLVLGQAFLSIGIDDVRGIHKLDGINWGGKRLEFQQGSGLAAYPSGLHAPLDALNTDQAIPVDFSFNLALDGIEQLSFTPVGKNNRIELKSNWPHPQFAGRFLPAPQSRIVSANGFGAIWEISSLASNAQPALSNIINAKEANNLSTVDSFSVGFIEPINVYSMAERAVKYGLLFIVLTFSAFFLFEILKQLPIHPVQYGLVGLALALFFLLLVSLSEQIAFLRAYLIASGACILLNGFYLAHVLRNWKRGFGFGLALTLLYGVLYGVLQSENNALLMGSILLFGVLSAIMVATRKVDWYRIGKDSLEPGSPAIAG